MSSLPDRHNSPRRRIGRGSRLHPGMWVWLRAFAAGIVITPAMACAVRQEWWAFAIVGSIGLLLMGYSCRDAENLTDRAP